MQALTPERTMPPRPLSSGWTRTSPTRLPAVSRLLKIVSGAVEDFLGEAPTALKKSQTAVFMARTGVDLEYSEELAREAVADSAGAPARQLTTLQTNLAEVLLACDRTDEATATLEEMRDAAGAANSTYWIQLARAYQLAGRGPEAIDSLITVVALRPNPDVEAELMALGLDAGAIAERTGARKEELLNFEPGHFDGEETGRGVLAELFTGANCGPCVAAGRGLDYVAEYFPRSTVAILEFHTHIAGANPLVNDHSLARQEFYGVNSAPQMR